MKHYMVNIEWRRRGGCEIFTFKKTKKEKQEEERKEGDEAPEVWEESKWNSHEGNSGNRLTVHYIILHTHNILQRKRRLKKAHNGSRGMFELTRGIARIDTWLPTMSEFFETMKRGGKALTEIFKTNFFKIILFLRKMGSNKQKKLGKKKLLF